ncbi:MAG: TIGR00269 family protein [Promethearchaeota archaeon]
MSKEKCMMCGRPAIVGRSYSGEVLCEQCFGQSLIEKTRKAISKWNMLQRTDRIAVALSGGKDSAVLLSILVNIQSRFPESEIIAVTLNEGKAEDSERIKIVTKLTQQLDVDYVVSSYQDLFSVNLDEVVSKAREMNSPLSPCSFCAVLRRQGLNILARRIDADKLALGHNLDDEVQSMLMNLIRGDLQRLARSGPVQKASLSQLVPRIKPLYYIPEEDIALYAQFLGLPSQTNPCSYRDQSLRSEIRSWLNSFEGRHSGSKYNLYATISRIIAILQTQPQEDFEVCRICGEPTSREICSTCQLLKELGLKP